MNSHERFTNWLEGLLDACKNKPTPQHVKDIRKKIESLKSEDRAAEVLKKVKLDDRMHHKPNELSGGQCQRVAIARALINNPSIILADEPTGNLDSKTSHEIMEILGKIHGEGNTVILVTHEEDISGFAHRVVRLKDGWVETDQMNEKPTVIL